ncbi:MAG TPA: lysophospholipid acyltransferase family protein [Micromonosporaceae bacterium]
MGHPEADQPRWHPPVLWRVALRAAPVAVAPLCRLRVTGDVPDDRRGGPMILAANHIGAFDPFVLAAACRRRRIAPRILATGGLFRAPVIGPVMRLAGHLRVDRRRPTVADALPAARLAIDSGAVVLAYPEGRITLDPGMWPERGKTGLARLAIATGVPVVPVAQWGAHLVLPWGAPRGMIRRLAWSLIHRPEVRVHFGPPVALDDVTALDPATPATEAAAERVEVREAMVSARAVRDATNRIIDALVDQLVMLRPDEPRLPAWIDSHRPLATGRTHRYRGSPGWPPR